MCFDENQLPNNSNRNWGWRIVMTVVLRSDVYVWGGGSFLPVFLIGGGEDVRHRRHVRIGQHEAEQQASRDLIPAQADGQERVVDDVHHGGDDFGEKTKEIIFLLFLFKLNSLHKF